MLVEKMRITRKHERKTVHGWQVLNRQTDLYVFVCDACGTQFSRTSKHVKPRQLNPGVLHACPGCQGPRFAANASKLRRKTLAQDASSTIDISKLR